MFPMKIICLLALVMSAVAIECPAGYEVVGSTCIHHLPGGYLTYDDAVNYCHQNFGRLPVLADCASFTEVATYVDDGGSTDAHNGYWLGATSPAPNHVWQWSDGTALQMGAPYWAANTGETAREPQGGTSQNCASIMPDRGWSIHDFACDASNFYPLCSITPVHGICPTPYVEVGTQCVHMIPSAHHWSSSRSQCGLTGGDLIVFDDCDQYRKVNLYLTEQGYNPDGYWIGGSDSALEGQWRWTNGSPMVMGLPYWGNVRNLIYTREGFRNICNQLKDTDVNLQCNDGKTALHYAASTGFKSVVAVFVETLKEDENFQEIFTRKDDTGHYSIDKAFDGGHDKLFRILLHRMEPNKKDKEFSIKLHGYFKMCLDEKNWTWLLNKYQYARWFLYSYLAIDIVTAVVVALLLSMTWNSQRQQAAFSGATRSQVSQAFADTRSADSDMLAAVSSVMLIADTDASCSSWGNGWNASDDME
ncbi:uncharacterized protein LOC108673367, partial [Hyalella azteca]|uniref:Uncharacterized protein LOC108673367 n=1 Tax=Hyalella azteca TaxID=294128 RepID=A0A8B7NSI2_HYAAZ